MWSDTIPDHMGNRIYLSSFGRHSTSASFVLEYEDLFAERDRFVSVESDWTRPILL